MKKCPPGVICIENVTLFFIFVCLILFFYILHNSIFNQKIQVNNNEKIVVKESSRENVNGGGVGWLGGFFPSYPYSNMPGDVLLNPYVPPLRDERYLIPQLNYLPPGALPINISTNAVDTSYRQVGILTPFHNKKGKILPLMGRPLYTRRDLWQYYTMSDSNHSVKLPIIYKGKNATNEYGVDKIYGDAKVYVEGYNEAFKVTIYENDVIKYIPFI